jgi:eukaryotic-like serine/threonine-protein kinase
MERMRRSREVIDDRFTIEQLEGFGGMGQVYRARDRRSSGLVALKVLHDGERLEIGRFAREAQVLATLSHPGIVRYIDSGITAEGEPYLVMEWLSGETLSARLQRTQITLAESLALGRRVASALGAIHRRGVVHRDLKPSNLFLRGSAIDEVVLIDFGMARRPITDPRLTVTGAMLGTPGYIAPEQVYNTPNLDGRADIFSLGCVLYRCLSGRAPFHGPDALRILLNGAPGQRPRLRELQPSIPQELDDLVARMLSRSPDDRPHTGDVVAAELLAIEESDPSPLLVRSGPRSVVSEIIVTERRLMCLVVARSTGRRPERPFPTVERDEQERALRMVVERHRGKLEVFADGSLLVILSHADAATDLAFRGARCALAIRSLLGNGSVVVVSGRAVFGPGVSESELLDRSMELLESTAKGTTVHIDELTSALVKNRFDTGSTGHHLRGELRESDRMRFLVSDPVTCVGRDQELAQLEAIFDQCTEERTASMVLMTGVTGVGKSCLGHEFLRRLRARGHALEIWFGEADPLDASAGFGLLAQVLRGALGVREDEPIDVRRERIRACVARALNGKSTRIAELLGEVVGTPFDREDRGAFDATHLDPRLLSEPLGEAVLSLLRAACAERPVVLVLEDLQWGDLPTINLIDAALGALSDQPLMVLGLARTEVHEIFPRLWADRRVQEIRLRKLSRRASEQLVRQVLGDAVAEETVKALVERSEGHASYLEEMIRVVAEGKGMATPPTVLAMVQARIEKLDPSARRVLRAASIFGEIFWRGGVEALLGGRDTAAWLAELVEQDVIAVKDDRRFPAEVEFRFRQPLVREAAYGMLTEGDMVAGHWLAGQWLEQAGETDTQILEEHFERCGRGGEPGSHSQSKIS